MRCTFWLSGPDADKHGETVLRTAVLAALRDGPLTVESGAVSVESSGSVSCDLAMHADVEAARRNDGRTYLVTLQKTMARYVEVVADSAREAEQEAVRQAREGDYADEDGWELVGDYNAYDCDPCDP